MAVKGSETQRLVSKFHVVYLPREVILILLMESKGITLYSLALGTSEPNYEWEY
jgi:hypothetical protein